MKPRFVIRCYLVVFFLFVLLGTGAPSVPSARAEPTSPWPSAAPSTSASFTLDPITFRLANAVLGAPYAHQLKAQGGVPGYTYKLVAGELPKGIELTPKGRLQGKPSKTGTWSFVAAVTDGQSRTAQQTYTLRITWPVAPIASAPAPSASVPQPPVQPPKPSEQALRVGDDKTVTTYRLEQADLDCLLQPETPEPELNPLPAAENQEEVSVPDEAAGINKDIKATLQPLLGAEYPERAQFESALRPVWCHLCETVLGICSPKSPCKACSSGAKASPTKPEEGALAAPCSQKSFDELVDSAKKLHRLLQSDEKDLGTKLDSKGCDCVRPEVWQDVIGFYPNWYVDTKTPAPDFELLSRINYFAAWIKDGEQVLLPGSLRSLQDFSGVAQRHRTEVDLTLLVDDWEFLDNPGIVDLSEPTEKVAQDVTELLNSRVTLQNSYATFADMLQVIGAFTKAHVPGFAEQQYLINGITLYLRPPNRAHYPKFAIYAHNLISQVTLAMKRFTPRPLSLNIVTTEDDIESSDDKNPLGVSALFDYFRTAEDPPMDKDGRLEGNSGAYITRTNITTRFLVMLNEPTGEHKKLLRAALDQKAAIHGSNRRVFLQKVVPVIASGATNLLQFRDDMATFAATFGGVGFWPAIGLAGVGAANATEGDGAAPEKKTLGKDDMAKAAKLEAVKPVNPQSIRDAIVDAFDDSGSSKWTIWLDERACNWRWPLRITFELLTLVLVVPCAFILLTGRVGKLNRQTSFLGLGALVAWVLLGGFILSFDPSLRELRKGNSLLATLVAILVLYLAFQLLRPRVPRP